MFGLILSLSGCVSNDTNMESTQKEDVSTNNREVSNYSNTGRNYVDPTPNTAEINGTILLKYINFITITFNNLSVEQISGNNRY